MSSDDDFSTVWLQNFRPSFDGQKVEDWLTFELYLAAGATTTITLEYKYSSLIGTPQGVIAVHLQAAVPGLNISPPPGQLIEMTTGSTELSWVITASQDFSGQVVVFFRLPNYSVAGDSPPFPIHIFDVSWLTDFKIFVNEKEVSWSDAWFYIMNGETIKLTLDVSSSSLTGVPGAAVSLDPKSGAVGGGLIVEPEWGQPVFMAEQTAITWELSLKPEAANGPFELCWNIHGIPGVPASPTFCGNVLNDLWDEFDFEFNGSPIKFDDLFVTVVDGKVSTLTVNCEKSSVRGLEGASLALELQPGAGGDGLIIDPRKGVSRPIESDTKILAWDFFLRPNTGSLPFSILFSMPGLNRVPKSSEIRGHTYDDVWKREFTPYVNGLKAAWSFTEVLLIEGTNTTLKLDYADSWLVGLPDSFVSLQFEPGEIGQDIDCSPPFGTPVKMEEGSKSLTWTMSASKTTGRSFVVFFKLPFWEWMPHSPLFSGWVVDVEGALEVKFDTEVKKSKDDVFPCLGAKHVVTLFPKLGSRLLNKNVKVEWRGDSPESLGVEFKSVEMQQLTEQGISYALDCSRGSKLGKFSLVFSIAEWGLKIAELAMDLAHNKVVARRWTEQGGGPVRWAFIEVKSYFTNQLISGFPVTVIRGSSSTDEFTGEGGVLRVSFITESPVCSILNKYDGTYP